MIKCFHFSISELNVIMIVSKFYQNQAVESVGKIIDSKTISKVKVVKFSSSYFDRLNE